MSYSAPLTSYQETYLVSPIVTAAGVAYDMNQSFFSGAWGTANLAIYWPFRVPRAVVARKLFWQNGSAAGSNSDIGIFDAGGTKLISTGSTAGSGNNALQVTDITDTDLLPGNVYWLGFSHNSTTANRLTLLTGGSADDWALGLGVRQESSAFALPATASLTTFTATTKMPLMGIQTRSVWT